MPVITSLKTPFALKHKLHHSRAHAYDSLAWPLVHLSPLVQHGPVCAAYAAAPFAPFALKHKLHHSRARAYDLLAQPVVH